MIELLFTKQIKTDNRRHNIREVREIAYKIDKKVKQSANDKSIILSNEMETRSEEERKSKLGRNSKNNGKCNKSQRC